MKAAIHEVLTQEIASTPAELVNVWREALQQGAEVIGICCGGTPDDVRSARGVYDEIESSR